MRVDLAAIPVVLSGLYLIALAGLAFASPQSLKSFLSSFASTAKAHFVELALRLVVGTSLLLYAPRMMFSLAFEAVGWVLIVTTLGLLLMPWRWHQRFARWSVPQALRYPALFGTGALAAGIVVLLAVGL